MPDSKESAPIDHNRGATSPSDGDEPAFRVVDRRGTDDDDETLEAPDVSEEERQLEEGSEKSGDALPPIDFSTFVMSLSTSAMVHLSEDSKNLPMARQVIDILSILEKKTIGNLTSDEKAILERVLYDLRMRFVSAAS